MEDKKIFFCEDIKSADNLKTTEKKDSIDKELLANGTPVFVNKTHRFGTDAMILSHFCKIHRNWAGCDLGTGCGIIPLRWHDMGHIGRGVGVEIDPTGAKLFEKSIACLKEDNTGNNIDVTAVCSDMRTLNIEGGFDVVSCNPPYFTSGKISEKDGRGVARHEVSCTPSDVTNAAKKLLKEGGRLCVCNRPERLTDYIVAARNSGLEPKRIRLVKNTQDSLPWLFLLDCRKSGRAGLIFESDLIMQAENGGFSEEILKIYGKEV